ncbi:hypothetical protein F974_01893 [Acinetobacter sp. CIP 102159]|uniref:hypothetical protein n=1 Tax=Acinetobacter sp. CIP 102159 TaxID=1144667 RepID=UPI0002CFC5E8|nr:hypothetical protein [Acinetobacter sp. CIP 102159]ENU83061.1 hypothetical protein F974_01893 [Acinetobacter sp. CIP 102159]
MNRDNDFNKASSDARADRLASWVKTHYRNKQEFIDKFGLNQGEITNIIAKKRVIGERKARKLESQTDIPYLYLDGVDTDQAMLGNSVTFAEDSYIIASRFPKLAEILKKIDKLEKDKKLSAAELIAIDTSLNNALNNVEDLIEVFSKARMVIPTKKDAS